MPYNKKLTVFEKFQQEEFREKPFQKSIRQRYQDQFLVSANNGVYGRALAFD